MQSFYFVHENPTVYSFYLFSEFKSVLKLLRLEEDDMWNTLKLETNWILIKIHKKKHKMFKGKFLCKYKSDTSTIGDAHLGSTLVKRWTFSYPFRFSINDGWFVFSSIFYDFILIGFCYIYGRRFELYYLTIFDKQLSQLAIESFLMGI